MIKPSIKNKKEYFLKYKLINRDKIKKLPNKILNNSINSFNKLIILNNYRKYREDLIVKVMRRILLRNKLKSSLKIFKNKNL